MDIGSSSDRYRVTPPVGSGSGSYQSASGTGSRTVVVVPDDVKALLPEKAGQTVSAQQVAKMRAVIKARYGEAIAKTAFREIEYRQTPAERGLRGRFGIKTAKEVKGHHLTTATLRALEMASPNVRAHAVKQRADSALAALEPKAAELRTSLKEKRQDYSRIYSEHVQGDYTFGAAPLSKQIAEIEGELEDLDQAIAEEKKNQQAALQSIADYQNNPLDATAFGKAQQRLDKVGADRGFHSLLNDTYARGEALHGKGGTAHRITPTADTPKAIAKEVVGVVLPPVGVAMAFHSAIKAEDRQRRLGNAAKFLDDHPLAKTVAKSIEATAEVEKNKAALTGTVAFVAMGATAHFAPVALPGLTAVANPLSSAVGSGVSNALSGHMSHVGAQVLSTTSSIATGRAFGEVQGRAARSVAPGSTGSARAVAQPQEVPLPEGTIPPTVPIEIDTPEGKRTKEFDLGKAGPALLHYLGPKVGDTGDPQEQNRKELRDLLGARPGDDFVPGAKVSAEEHELHEKVARALDNPDAKGAAELIRSVSPLRLLHIAQGWR
jgi:hypothetical protein